jgi:hypothetical protein
MTLRLVLQKDVQQCRPTFALFHVMQREGGERSCGPGAMRFAAHFALALRATGLVAEPSWEADQYDPLQVRLTEVNWQTALCCWW